MMYRLRHSSELGSIPVELDQFANSIIDPISVRWDRNPFSGQWAMVTLGGEEWTVPDEWLEETTVHQFPDTGMIRSWCKSCGVEGTFDWQSGIYKIL